MKRKLKYAVIILNYNTIHDAINAAKSVICNAQNEEYIICIVDNGSSLQYDISILESLEIEHIITMQIKKNGGYAKGNNRGIKFVLQNYNPEYIVIMNPDVSLIEKGTIETIIEKIERSGHGIVGGQPLVWNYHYGNNPRMQQNIRKVPTFLDLCITSFYPLRLLCSKRYKDITYLDKVPYFSEIMFHVPSGAFFVIETDVFCKIGMFDENTFLYYEEHILGYKLKELNKRFIFLPQLTVKHEHGKSTRFSRINISKDGTKTTTDSKCYYAEEYLNKGRREIILIKILSYLDYSLKVIVKFFLKLKNS